MVTSRNWLIKGLDKALKATTGYQLMPARFAAQNNVPSLKLFGLTYTFADWKHVDYVSKGYSQNASLYSIINRITRTAAMCPFKVYRVKDEKKLGYYKSWTGVNATKESVAKAMMLKAQVYEEDNKHPLNELIDRPNEWQGGKEFTENSIGFKLITGNRFLFKNTLTEGANQGRPLSIYNLPPQYMVIMPGQSLFEVKAYKLQLNQTVDIPKEYVLHSRYWNPNFDPMGEHLWGMSPLRAASRNVDRASAGEERSVAMLQNAGAAGILFDKMTGGYEGMTPEQAGQFKRKLNEEVLGLGNAGKIAVANGDLGYLNFGLTAVEMEVLNLEKWSMQQLCNVFGVPYVLFSADNSSYNNIKEAKKELITMAVIPELASLRDDWNEIASAYKGENIYVDYDISTYPELQEDLEKTAKIMAMSWWVKPNEKRLAMNLDEDQEEEMMDQYLVPVNLTTIGDLNPANLDNQMNQVDQQQQDNNQGNA